MIRIKTTVGTLLYLVTAFFISSYALLESVNMGFPGFIAKLNSWLRYAGFIMIVLLLPHVKKFFRKEYRAWLFALFLVVTALYISGYVNKFDLFTRMQVLFFVELTFIIIFTVETNRVRLLLNFLTIYIFVLIVLNDITVFHLFGFIKQGAELRRYLIGTKFKVSYLHMFGIAFVCLQGMLKGWNKTKTRMLVSLMTVYSLFIAIVVNCNTGMIGILIISVLTLWLTGNRQGRRLLFRPSFFVLVYLICGTIEFVIMGIVQLPFVTHIVVDILHRTTSLTGRTDIYMLFIPVMQGHWTWGYGLSNVNSTIFEIFGYTNTQNALLQWIFKAGLVTTGAISFWLVSCLGGAGKAKESEKIFPVALIVYVYMLLGIVEITYLNDFFMWMAVVCGWSKWCQRKEKQLEAGYTFDAKNS